MCFGRVLFFLLILARSSHLAWAQGQTVTFSATGDIPYGTGEISILKKQITDHNKYSPSQFFVHLGDILSGSESCADARYALLSSELQRLAVPAYIVPGDNETTDCKNPSQGMNWWLQYFTNFEQNFCGAPFTEHQSGRIQNFAFVLNGVLFVGIDLVGANGTSSSDQQKDADWVEQQFTAKFSQVRAAVVFAQAGPGSGRGTFFDRFEDAAASFGKPILYIHGDGHSWVKSNPWSTPNTLRVQVNNGGAEDPVEVTVTMNTTSPASTFTLKRDPWSKAAIVNTPPCADAGPDKMISGSSSMLQGQAKDDGDPNGTLTTVWSKVSGPGTVTFGNANALSTTASFSVDGVYTLQLTADDGQLQSSDNVTIGVNAGISNLPVINSFAPTNGTVGTMITIAGSHFTGAADVAFNGTPVVSFTIDSDTQISTAVPAGATTGKITVTNAVGIGMSSGDFTVNTSGGGTPPVTFYPVADTYVESINPASNYGTATDLRIEMNSASDLAQTYLKFDISGVSGLVQSAKIRLQVADPSSEGGSIFLVSNNYQNTSTPWVENGLLWNNAPAITGNALSTLGAVSDGQTVELDVSAAISGNGIYSFALQNNSTNSVLYDSKETANPPELVIQTSNPPSIASFSPASGPVATEVTITGSQFTHATSVGFNGTPAVFNIDSDTQIRADVPIGAATGKISVTNADGAGFSAADFVVTAPPSVPSISAFAPVSGPAGTMVTVEGNNFNGATSVTFNGVSATGFTIDSDTQISATVPAAATTGKIAVTNSAGTATSADDFTITTAGGGGTDSLIFYPTDDAYVHSLNPTDNFGSLPDLHVEMNSASDVSNFYVKFNVAGLKGPVQSAKLRLLVIDPSSKGGSIFAVSNDYQATSTLWVESGLVWNNAPAITGSALSSLDAVAEDQTVELDITAAITGNGIYSFAMTTSHANAAEYSSKEGAVPPKLIIQVTPQSINHEETQTGGSANAATVSTSASLLAADGHLYVAAISTQLKVGVLAVSGLGLNWTPVKQQCSGINTTNVEVWMAQGTPSGNDFVTATLAGAPSTAVIAVSRYSGVSAASPIGNVISGNTNGVNGSAACTGGAASEAYSFNTATTVDEAVVYAAVAIKARTHTPGAGYTERAEIKQIGGGLTSAIAVEDKTIAAAANVAVEGSLNGTADWAMVALEIRPENAGPAQYTLTMNTAGAGSVALDPPDGVYDAGAVVTLTATPAAGYQFSSWSGDLAGSTNPATLAMQGNKDVTATFAEVSASGTIVHEETQTGGSANAATVTTSASLLAADGHLYVAAISTQLKVGVLAVSGLGLNWTPVKQQCSGINTTNVEVWMAQGTPSGNGFVTTTLAGAPSTAVIAVSRYSGVSAASPIGNVISGNTNGVNGSAACSGGAANEAYSFNTATTVDEAVVYAAVAIKARTHTPGTGYTEQAEIKQIGGGLTSAIAVEDKTIAAAANVTVDGSLNGTADWAMVALEIRPQNTVAKHAEIAANDHTAPPADFQLEQNYPNPFNPGTQIRFGLPRESRVTIKVYTINGVEVKTLVDGNYPAGSHAITFHAENLTSGTYFYVMQAGEARLVRRLVLVK